MFKVNNKNTRTRCEICSKFNFSFDEKSHEKLLTLLNLNVCKILIEKYLCWGFLLNKVAG